MAAVEIPAVDGTPDIRAKIIIVILLAYIIPVYLVGADLLVFWLRQSGVLQASDGDIQPYVLKLFIEFAKNPDSIAQFHKLLLPLISGLSILVLKDNSKFIKTFKYLVTATTITLVFSVIVEVMFNVAVNGINAAASDAISSLDEAAAHTFFSRVQENTLMYLMVLLGLRAAN